MVRTAITGLTTAPAPARSTATTTTQPTPYPTWGALQAARGELFQPAQAAATERATGPKPRQPAQATVRSAATASQTPERHATPAALQQGAKPKAARTATLMLLQRATLPVQATTTRAEAAAIILSRILLRRARRGRLKLARTGSRAPATRKRASGLRAQSPQLSAAVTATATATAILAQVIASQAAQPTVTITTFRCILAQLSTAATALMITATGKWMRTAQFLLRQRAVMARVTGAKHAAAAQATAELVSAFQQHRAQPWAVVIQTAAGYTAVTARQRRLTRAPELRKTPARAAAPLPASSG